MSRLYNILNALVSRGGMYSGNWTKSSTSAINEKVTQNLTLPKGTYVVTLKVPVFSSDSSKYWFGLGGTGNDALYSNQYATQQPCTWVLELSSDSTVYGQTQQSAATSMDTSYLDRGYIKAIRVA